MGPKSNWFTTSWSGCVRCYLSNCASTLITSTIHQRDQITNAPSSATQSTQSSQTSSSTSTVRGLTPRPGRNGHPNPHPSGSPVLLRADRIHVNQPRTPDPDPDCESIVLIGSKGKDKERDGDELELDLESLGLEDREISVDKLTKLEKIGSGGFKE